MFVLPRRTRNVSLSAIADFLSTIAKKTQGERQWTLLDKEEPKKRPSPSQEKGPKEKKSKPSSTALTERSSAPSRRSEQYRKAVANLFQFKWQGLDALLETVQKQWPLPNQFFETMLVPAHGKMTEIFKLSRHVLTRKVSATTLTATS